MSTKLMAIILLFYSWNGCTGLLNVQCECYDYLFKWAIRMLEAGKPLARDATAEKKKSSKGSLKRKFAAIVDESAAASTETPSNKKLTKLSETGAQKIVLLDIEGTITSISFVADVLFPYARKHTKAFLDEHSSTPAVIAIVDSFRDLGMCHWNMFSYVF